MSDYLNYRNAFLAHHGILGQKWGIRRFQNKDGSLTPEGRERYGVDDSNESSVRIDPKLERSLRSLKESGYKMDEDGDLFKSVRIPNSKTKIDITIDSKTNITSDKTLSAIKNFEKKELPKIINDAKRKLADDYGYDVDFNNVMLSYDDVHQRPISFLISIPTKQTYGYSFAIPCDGDKVLIDLATMHK